MTQLYLVSLFTRGRQVVKNGRNSVFVVVEQPLILINDQIQLFRPQYGEKIQPALYYSSSISNIAIFDLEDICIIKLKYLILTGVTKN